MNTETRGTSLENLFSRTPAQQGVDVIDTFSVEELRDRLKRARDMISKTNEENRRMKEANLKLQGLS